MIDEIGGGKQVILLRAFFDESERPGGLLCVAGFAFPVKHVRKANKEWRHLFDQFGGFHMKNFAHGNPPYAGTSRSERHELMKRAVEIINARKTVGVAVSCRLEEMKKFSPRWIRGFGNAYPVCCHWVMCQLIMALDRIGRTSDTISYVFEAGHPHESEAREFVRMMSSTPELKAYFRHHSDSFVPKQDAVLLQAADLLAYEFAKFQDETREQKKRPMRASLKALVTHSPHTYLVAHVEGERLARAMREYREKISQDNQEAIAKLMEKAENKAASR